jgi:hypothetical protein
MSDLANGTLVQHVSLGVGKIVAIEPHAVHVFFPAAEKRFATKLRLPTARAFLRTDAIAPDTWLQGLSAFTLDPLTRRYALAASWVTHEQAVAQFVAARPQGFPPGSAAKDDRAGRWRLARDAWARTLGGGEGERLLEAGELAEVATRILAVERHVAALHPEEDETALADALADPETPAVRLFFERLFELLSVPSPSRARFDRLFAAATALPADPRSAWVVATLLPFVAEPTRHAMVRPATTAAAALRLGCDPRRDDAPNWNTYVALRTFCAKLLEDLRSLGARDLADVETFLHVIATTRPKAAKKKGTGGARRPGPVRTRVAAVRGRRPGSASRARAAR